MIDSMSANINQEMSCFSVILCDHCKTRGRLFNKHHILSINNNPFPGTRWHWLPTCIYNHQRMFRKHRKRNVNNILGLTCIAQNKPLTVSYVIMRHAKIAFLTH